MCNRKILFFKLFVFMLTLINVCSKKSQVIKFLIYELLSNVYKCTFLEYGPFRWCDMIFYDNIIGKALRKAGVVCPTPVGYHHIKDSYVPFKEIPKNFPITKGRMYVNMTHIATKENVFQMHIDIELKDINMKNWNVSDKVH